MTFKNEIHIMPMHAGQEAIWKTKKRFNIVPTGRRFGKTTFMEIVVCMLASMYHIHTKYDEYHVGWFAPHYKFLKNSFNRIERVLKPLIKRASIQDKTIELVNGAVIQFWTLEDRHAGNGEKYHYVFIDEAGLSKDLIQHFENNIRPTLTDYKGKLMVVGTPKGINDYYRLYEYALDNPQDWKVHTATSYDNPALDPAEINHAREHLTPTAFKQEYMGQFVDSQVATRIIEREKLERCFIPLSDFEKYHVSYHRVAGFDIAGTGDDSNAVVVLDGNIITDIYVNLDFERTLSHIDSIQDKFTHLVYDATGVGNTAYTHLNKFLNFRSIAFNFGRGNVTGVNTTYISPLKNGEVFWNRATQLWYYLKIMIENTCKYLDGEDIRLEDCIFFVENQHRTKLIRELTQAVYKPSDDVLMKVDKAPDNAPSPNIADAVIMSLSRNLRNGLKIR